MSYQRMSRAHRHARWAKAKKERAYTGLGLLYRLLRFLSLSRLTKLLMRRPWHIADLYVDGRFAQAIYVYPKETAAQRIARLKKEAEKLMAAAAQSAAASIRLGSAGAGAAAAAQGMQLPGSSDDVAEQPLEGVDVHGSPSRCAALEADR
jgi:hypothetical protein